MRKPNLFIVGAPKCGTTAMYEHLKTHPEVFMSARKELHYFSPDARPNGAIEREQQYLSYFSEASDETWIGEGSVWHLYSPTAASRIHAFSPDARILVMVRNPVDMMHALHSQLLFNSIETLSRFEDALGAEEDRARGQRVPSGITFPERLLYRRAASFSTQIERYFDVFGRERVHCVVFDDLKAAPEAEVRRACAFLGVSTQHRVDPRPVNPNKVLRSTALQRFVNRSNPIRRVGRLLVPQGMRHRLLRMLFEFNTRAAPRRPVAPETRARLQGELRPEVERLSALLDRDLTNWCRLRP